MGLEERDKQRRANIVLILVDDMGYSDIGCFGSEIATSNIDRMGSEGVVFTQMYNCGRCCPSRASLLTGLYPHQAGIGHMTTDLGDPALSGLPERPLCDHRRSATNGRIPHLDVREVARGWQVQRSEPGKLTFC